MTHKSPARPLAMACSIQSAHIVPLQQKRSRRFRMVEPYVLRAFPSWQQAEWDAFIEGRSGGHLLQSWGWGDLKRGANWQPLRLALYTRVGGEMVAAAQVLRRTALHLPPRLGHLAYLPRGPVLAWTATTPDCTAL